MEINKARCTFLTAYAMPASIPLKINTKVDLAFKVKLIAPMASARANISVNPIGELRRTLGDIQLKQAISNALREPNAARKQK